MVLALCAVLVRAGVFTKIELDFLHVGHTHEAIETYQMALVHNPALVDAHFNLGIAHQDKKELREARVRNGKRRAQEVRLEVVTAGEMEEREVEESCGQAGMQLLSIIEEESEE